MERKRWNCTVEHNATDILDRAIHRVEQKQPLDRQRIAIHRVEDRGHIHQQHGEHVVQIRNIPEEHEQGRQDQADANVKDHQAGDRIEDRDELPRERHAVDRREEEEHKQRDAEVDNCRNILRQQEDILGHVDLREDVRVLHQGVHAAGGGFAEEAEQQVACKQVSGVMIHGSAEELREHQLHHQQGQERRENAPPHAQHGALVLLLEVAFDEFFKQKSVLH